MEDCTASKPDLIASVVSGFLASASTLTRVHVTMYAPSFPNRESGNNKVDLTDPLVAGKG